MTIDTRAAIIVLFKRKIIDEGVMSQVELFPQLQESRRFKRDEIKEEERKNALPANENEGAWPLLPFPDRWWLPAE